MEKAKPITQSSCSILIPEELCEKIQEIRLEHDKSVHRWPPHINLLFPFIGHDLFPQAKSKIESSPLFKTIKPFTLRLTQFHNNPGSKFIHIQVEVKPPPESNQPQKQPQKNNKRTKKGDSPTLTDLERLQQLMHQLFPACAQESSMVPLHVSVGQFDQTKIPDYIQDFQTHWEPIEFEVTQLVFMHRTGENSPMQSNITIPLNL